MAITLTKQQVRLLLSRNKNADEWVDLINEILPKYKIDTVDRVAAFFAQTCVESIDFSVLEENLMYSTKGLQRVFGKYFRDKDASAYARQPEKIANLVYGNRMGNGDVSSGDGYRYRGRGVIQLTGKSNYSRFAKAMGMELSQAVEYVSTKKGALEAACWFWSANGLNDIADKGDITAVSKRVNGGTHGLSDRRALYKKFIVMLRKPSDNAIEPSKKGDRGLHVKAIQQMLDIHADGIFGPTTLYHVKKFQSKHNLEVTGVADTKTIAEMMRSQK